MSYTGRNSERNGQLSSELVANVPLRKDYRRRSSDAALSRSARSEFSLVVHSHLCWDWVWQRPQQFLSRLSQRHPVLFVETVGPDAELLTPLARLRTLPEFPNISVLRVQFPNWRWDDGAYVDRERCRIVKEALRGPLRGKFKRIVQWFYDPMAFPAFHGKLNEVATVYDCMDELSQFRFAPPEIKRREADLLKNADVVFTGGRRLFESKSQHNANTYFYGCGVDVEHFGSARTPAVAVPAEMTNLTKPVLGYFGVIDERIDYELLGKLADARPDWSVVMVGPVCKVDENSLPRRANLHWLGRQDYAQLPAFAKGFDVCLMPFALNEATEYINPTKSLEYMATGRVIVGTAVPDVVANFGSVVRVAHSHEEFVALCEAAAETVDPAIISAGLEMATANSWESIVGKLESHVEEVLLRPGAEQTKPTTEVTHGNV